MNKFYIIPAWGFALTGIFIFGWLFTQSTPWAESLPWLLFGLFSLFLFLGIGEIVQHLENLTEQRRKD